MNSLGSCRVWCVGEASVSPSILSFFSQFIEREAGILFHDINLYQLQSRLEEVVRLEKLKDLDELYAVFKRGASTAQIDRLIDQATNNETLFFRDPGFFDAFKRFVVDEILPTGPSELRFWSAAASTGQEAISMAIALDELSRTRPLPPVKILATDICHRALDKARKGTYSDFEIGRGLSDERRDRYFKKTAEGWRVSPSISAQISFAHNNLIHSTVQDQFHVIFCRNVLIYQKVEMKAQVVRMLLSQLAPGGGIILGVGETLMGVSSEVESRIMDKVVVYTARGTRVRQAA